MRCPSCHGENRSGRRFCATCGTSLAQACPACGFSNRPGEHFCGGCGSALKDSPVQPRKHQPVVAAERRQLTVMFCDLVGSTALADRLDPEDLREVMRAYRSACQPAIERYEGRVAQYLGDGVMVYFGYPEAHEDDAERAVRAGLDIVEAVRVLEAPEGLLVRVGIATGPVVVGAAAAAASDLPGAAVGETPNLAWLMQSLAAPNTVIVTERTRRLTGAVFEYEDLGPSNLKGLSEPVHAFRAVREHRFPTRFESIHRDGLTPLVDRESEVALLLDRWQRATRGDGQVVLVGGEPGIGKSRIVEALRGRLAEPHIEVRHQCTSYHSNSAMHPIIAWLEDTAGFTRLDSPSAKLDKLEALLAQATPRLDAVAPLFSALLSIPTDDRYPTATMTPRALRQKTLEAIVELTFGLASLRPLLLVVEDVHWIDPSTRELLDLCIDRISTVRVLMVITHRPGFTPLWAGRGPVTAFSLSRLSPTECEELIKPLVEGKALPREVVNQIVTRTEGVPLFVEELTKTIRESGLLADEGDRYEVTSPLLPLAIPATLRDSLVARLDRLGAIKEVAQIGAAIGREFPYALLAAVSAAAPDGSLEESLLRLETAELVYRTGVTPEAIYRFKHALVQEAAHESMLKSKRQELHGRIAGVLEQEYSDLTRTEPEVLARHYAEAGMIDKAVSYWRMAGNHAIEHSANLEASSHFSRGLALLMEAPATVEHQQQELALQIGRGIASIAVKGYAAPETGKAYARARELCSSLGASRELFQALFGLWGHHWVRAELHEAHRLALDIQSQARLQADSVPMIVAHRVLGSTLFTLGEFASAREQLEKTLALSGGEDRLRLAALYAVEPRVAALLVRSWVLWLLGYPDAALRSAQEGRTSAEHLAHAYSLAFAAFVVSAVHSMRGDVEAARAQAELCMTMSDEHQITQYATLSRVVRGWALTQLGQRDAGLAEIKTNIARSRRTGVAFMRSWMLAGLAESYAQSGDAEKAEEAIDEALKHVESTGERLWEADLHRLRGEVVLMSPSQERDRAESSLLHALEIARKQGAKSLELRAASSIALLWRNQGRVTDARALLAPVYDWFTEGFETADLRKARAVLDGLG